MTAKREAAAPVSFWLHVEPLDVIPVCEQAENGGSVAKPEGAPAKDKEDVNFADVEALMALAAFASTAPSSSVSSSGSSSSVSNGLAPMPGAPIVRRGGDSPDSRTFTDDDDYNPLDVSLVLSP